MIRVVIPRIIHQIWLGPCRFPAEWASTWIKHNPNMNYILWDEKGIDEFDLVNRNKYDYFIAKEDYQGAADVARVEILNKYGGVYIDIDSICLIPIENESFMYDSFFACIEYDRRVANGVIGTIANHPIMNEYCTRLYEATVIEPPCYTIGGTLLTSCIDDYGRNKVTILPRNNFYPRWGRKHLSKDKIYSRHMWGVTKNLYAA